MKIKNAAREPGRLEWCLQNSIDELALAQAKGTVGRDLEDASRALLCFCSDSMDWGSSLYRECVEIAEEGLRLSKGARN